ncbi:hypothetical protein AXA44_44305 [Rhodococcus sp. SC4]|nr:hypothetical protein AXA44_44305 [Rhodococcus sp. SC4]
MVTATTTIAGAVSAPSPTTNARHDFTPPARRRGPAVRYTTGPHGGASWADTGRVQHFLADHEFAVTAVMSGLIVTLAVAAISSVLP